MHYTGDASIYERIMRGVGVVMQDYDWDKQFSVFGFGAHVPPDDKISHQFFANFSDDPHCYGVNGNLISSQDL